MTKLKTIALLCFLICACAEMNAQSYKFLATGFSVMEKDEKGNWGKWSELQPSSITITLDTDKNRIIVYSQEIQLYKIVQYQKKQENDDDLTYPFTCADEDGWPFIISIITRKKQDNRKQMYINQKNTIIVYNIINYPDKNIGIK
jgi:hypothetical protein